MRKIELPFTKVSHELTYRRKLVFSPIGYLKVLSNKKQSGKTPNIQLFSKDDIDLKISSLLENCYGLRKHREVLHSKLGLPKTEKKRHYNPVLIHQMKIDDINWENLQTFITNQYQHRKKGADSKSYLVGVQLIYFDRCEIKISCSEELNIFLENNQIKNNAYFGDSNSLVTIESFNGINN